MQIRTVVVVLFLVTLLAGCAAPLTRRVQVSDSATRAEAAKQAELAVQEVVQEQVRLARVARSLETKGSALCGSDTGPSIGVQFFVKPKGQFGPAYASLYGIHDRPTVLFVQSDSPAAVAGVHPRDILSKLNGNAITNAASVAEVYQGLPPDMPIHMEVIRDGVPVALTIQPDRACRYPVVLEMSQNLNAYADGKKVMVTRGMMNFAKDDNELALVIAHELAHNTMKHMDAKRQNMAGGLLADVVAAVLTRGQAHTNFAQAGANAYSQEFEAEADYVGLYIMAVAGRPIQDAPTFWRRMAVANPSSIATNYGASHPSTPYRMVALEATVKEIAEKVARGVALTPNMKDGKPNAPTSAQTTPPATPPTTPSPATPPTTPPSATPPTTVPSAQPTAPPAGASPPAPPSSSSTPSRAFVVSPPR